MGAVAFDTLKFAKRLKEAGFSEQQAEALAEAEAELFEAHLATKQDIAELKREIAEVRREVEAVRTELKRDFEELRDKVEREIAALRDKVERDVQGLEGKFERDLKDLEYRMIIKLGSLMVLAVGVVATLVKLL